MLSTTLLPLIVIAGGLTSSIAPADAIEVSAIVSSGSGLSLSGAGGKTLTTNSPVFLNLESMFRLDRRPWLGLGVGAQLELQGRVGVALVPKVRAFLPGTSRVRSYASVGIPFYLFPYTLFGASGGFGMEVHLGGPVHLVAELSATGFFLGSDLMQDSSLVKLDLALGLRLQFGPG